MTIAQPNAYYRLFGSYFRPIQLIKLGSLVSTTRDQLVQTRVHHDGLAVGIPPDTEPDANRAKGLVHVALVDDDVQFRRNLQRILELEDDIRVVAEAGSADEAVDTVMTADPDVVLMDIRLGGITGLEAIRLLRAKGFAGAVLVFTMYDDSVEEALQVGASGYMLKGASREELLGNIRGTPPGGFFFGASLMATPRGAEAAFRYLASWSARQARHLPLRSRPLRLSMALRSLPREGAKWSGRPRSSPSLLSRVPRRCCFCFSGSEDSPAPSSSN